MGDITDYLICPRCDSDHVDWIKEEGDCLWKIRCEECGCEFIVREYTSYSVEKITKEPDEDKEKKNDKI